MAQSQNFIQRLFGNENAEQRQPIGEDDWAQKSIAANANAAPRAAVVQAQDVNVVSLPKPADPALRMSVSIDLSVAGPKLIQCRGNAVLYADSTNGTDRLLAQYRDNDGDVTQPLRSMVPGRLRRERYFNQLNFTWTVTAGATATIEIYDDPDGALYIQD